MDKETSGISFTAKTADIQDVGGNGSLRIKTGSAWHIKRPMHQ
ncbi:hypothetical protein [Rhizobium mesosinicum]|nr:hypothetical protein [Rhizobium mesosinicum]